jgi:3-oxoacyl-[acyl-carrier protein] reductase
MPAYERGDEAMRLDGKVAVITGATSGFGRAIADRFAVEGAALVLSGRRAALGEQIVAELQAAGADASFVAGDVADPTTSDAIAETARDRYGRIDVLVLNAGIGRPGVGPFWTVPIEDFDELFATNVRGVWLVARAAVPLMSSGGSIVVMASISSYMVSPEETLYSATKGAVLQLARGMAGDLAERGIRVNAVNPGPTATGWTEGIEPTRMPFGRWGEPDDAARLIAWLCGDEGRWVTGQVIDSEGGFRRS